MSLNVLDSGLGNISPEWSDNVECTGGITDVARPESVVGGESLPGESCRVDLGDDILFEVPGTYTLTYCEGK